MSMLLGKRGMCNYALFQQLCFIKSKGDNVSVLFTNYYHCSRLRKEKIVLML